MDVPILLDGGIRRETEVVKALALGETMERKTKAAMAMCDCATVSDVTRNNITRHPSGGGRVGRHKRPKEIPRLDYTIYAHH
jgi:isopentenyl diphosphate isomerase/L-lactate dehydrogenase-like FMN-dependent dehydrogenase